MKPSCASSFIFATNSKVFIDDFIIFFLFYTKNYSFIEIWKHAQAASAESSWIAGFDELRISLGSESLRAEGRFEYPKGFLNDPSFTATMRKIVSRDRACKERLCQGLWNCHWPWSEMACVSLMRAGAVA